MGVKRKHTQNFRRHSLQERRARLTLGLRPVPLLGFFDKRWTTRLTQSRRTLPGPATVLRGPYSSKVPIAPAQTLSTQTDLLPSQESSARATKVGGLLQIGNFVFGAFGWGVIMVDMGVDEGLGHTCNNQSVCFFFSFSFFRASSQGVHTINVFFYGTERVPTTTTRSGTVR